MELTDEGMDPRSVELFHKFNLGSEGFTHAQMLEAMGILIYEMTEGDHGRITQSLQLIGNVAANIYTETMN